MKTQYVAKKNKHSIIIKYLPTLIVFVSNLIQLCDNTPGKYLKKTNLFLDLIYYRLDLDKDRYVLT